MLAPHLTEDTAGELLAAAAGKSKAEVERLLAARFPRTDLLTWLEAVPASALPGCTDQHAPGHVDEQVPPGEGRVQHAPAHAGDRPKVAPLSAGSFALQLTMSSGTHDKLRYAQELLGHQVASGDLAEVLDRVLDLAIVQLEKQKFAATARPRRRGRLSADPRHIPADIRRAVWERDQGQCTFVSDSGHRCEARKPLEFDHIQEVARGGEASVAGLRLRCRAHKKKAGQAPQRVSQEMLRGWKN